MKAIVKLQRPLSNPDGPILIYDQDRKHMVTVTSTPELKALLGSRVKLYAVARWVQDTWLIGPAVVDQAW